MKRIGFACKWIDRADQVDGIHPKDDCKKYNTGATTVAWLNRQTKDKAVEKLWSLVKQNIYAAKLLVEKVGNLDGELRMVRLSSDILPVYTEPTWCWFWREPDVVAYAEKHFAEVGRIARSCDVRLSFHPGQFTVLASDNPGIVDRSIEEFEYHADMARWMGYGREFQDFKINVHISGRQGPEGIRRAYQRLSPEARNCITIENEEISYGLDDCLGISDIVPIVLDIHHHWIREGEYIQRDDVRINRVIDSWRGRRPVAHYSVSREDVVVNHAVDVRPDLKLLLEAGYKRQKLRAHSDFMWNTAVNDWAYTHWEWADLMVESKAKNLASFDLHRHFQQLGF
ncbi:UV damage endonuclease UvsE [bacterium]|nr:UV damage endonuclease UvsE [bacterium]